MARLFVVPQQTSEHPLPVPIASETISCLSQSLQSWSAALAQLVLLLLSVCARAVSLSESSIRVSSSRRELAAHPLQYVLLFAILHHDYAARIIETAIQLPQPRTLELLDLLGVLPDILKTAREFPARTQYKDGAPFKTWNIVEPEDATPAVPYVRRLP